MKVHGVSRDRRPGLPDVAALRRENFLGWQCRLRQMAMRHDQGRPADGCRPQVWLPGNSKRSLGIITTLLTRRDPGHYTVQFRFIANKTQNPAERFHQGVRVLQESYYQDPEEFSDLLTALFSIDSPVCAALVEAGACTLHFDENTQGWQLPCVVQALEQQHAAFQAAYWHNFLFNSCLPGAVRILSFLPDWAKAKELTRDL